MRMRLRRPRPPRRRCRRSRARAARGRSRRPARCGSRPCRARARRARRRRAGRATRRAAVSPPNSAQVRLSQTRTVTGGRRRLVVHDDVEMGVERGDLVDLDQRQPHLLGQRGEMARVQAAEMVLQQMQMLDQQVAAPLAVAEQRPAPRPAPPDRPAGPFGVVGPRRRPEPG